MVTKPINLKKDVPIYKKERRIIQPKLDLSRISSQNLSPGGENESEFSS